MRRSTPRPAYPKATIVRYREAAHHIWGDEVSGAVFDRVYLSTRSLHCLEFQLAPGAEFRHSRTNPTIFAGDVTYSVMEGEFIIANPSSGEVLDLKAGESVLFHRDTWHHGFNPSPSQPTRVLEFFSPPPARGTASQYAQKQPFLEESRYRDDRWQKRWPEAAAEFSSARTLIRLSDQDSLWSFAQNDVRHLVGTLADTPFLRLASGRVQPGNVDAFSPVDTESLLVVTEGELSIDIEHDGEYSVAALSPGDAAYLPAGCSFRILGTEAGESRYLLGTGCELPEDWAP
ncbi:MAG: hypothetical protein KF742_02995 [Cryobacterium sp.]|nr:hypothetical protein [Cryobacterium sp.]